MTLGTDERAALTALVQRAAQNPIDMRDFSDPVKGVESTRIMRTLRIQLGSLAIGFSHDRLPPDWLPYRHLSVSDGGKQVADALFQEIAEAVGIGSYDQDHFAGLVRSFGSGFTTRHAFAPVSH